MVEHSSELTLSITTLSEQNSSAALRLLVLIRISFTGGNAQNTG